MQLDVDKFVASVVTTIQATFEAKVTPLQERIAALEQRVVVAEQREIGPAIDLNDVAKRAADLIPTPKDGLNGKDADMESVKALAETVATTATTMIQQMPELVASEVAKSIALMSPPKDGTNGKDGKDAESFDLDVLALKAAELIPKPKDGQDGTNGVDGVNGTDGTSVSVAELMPLIASEVQKSVAALPLAKDGRDGIDGRDGTSVLLDDLMPVVASAVTKAVAVIPPAQDGRDGKDGASVDPADVDAMVQAHVTKAVAVLPVPKDGTSVTLDDVVPLISMEVAKAAAVIPIPKDGVGVVGALIDRDGHLVVTLSDGTTKDVGPVVGRDVDMSVVTKMIADEVEKFPKPTNGIDGKDGLGFEDLEFTEDEHGRAVAMFSRGEITKSKVLPGIIDRGVYREGMAYLKGDGVSRDGSFWIAQADTLDKPGEGKTDWRLAVKKGGDGKPGVKGIDGKEGRPGKDFTPLPDRRPF